MTEFLHEVVAKRGMDSYDPWAISESPARLNHEATERLVQWLIDQQREEDNADNQSN